MKLKVIAAAAGMCLLFAAPALAQDEPAAGNDDHELAKQIANPVANLISVPFQHNIDCCYGESDALRYTLNVQPVVPVSLGPDWNVIVRTILPFISEESTAPGLDAVTGFGDITQTFFVSPKASKNGMVWAVGPVFLWPIGKARLGGEKWGAGPSALLLKQTPEGLTVGLLANHIWSYAGDDDRDAISNTFLQPFISHTFPDTTSVSLNTESTYDWEHKQWTVPINLSVGHIFKTGGPPVQLTLGGRYYADTPKDGPGWGVRFNMTFLFPTRKPAH